MNILVIEGVNQQIYMEIREDVNSQLKQLSNPPIIIFIHLPSDRNDIHLFSLEDEEIKDVIKKVLDECDKEAA